MIPLKLEKLLKGRTVEQNRVEYKEGWNPNDIIHTICAFANDFSNVNGGYLVIGIQAEEGLPILPPKGLSRNTLDSVQQEIFQYCNMITPRYIPRIEVVDYKNTGTFLIYLWCSAGDSGPYQASVDAYAQKGTKKDKRMYYWIRPASLTVAADRDEIAELFDKFNSVPFDDRINRKATIQDIRRGYLEDFLRDSKSSLVDEINESSLEDLLVSLEVANETDTELSIRNIGVLMFTERPDKFIPGAQIDLVKFNTEEAEGSDDFFEKTFYGPIWKQVRDVLDYINTNIIEEKVVKIQGQAESERYVNYPYNALEEAIVNAVFHKSYREPEPVEIRIYVDCIRIINFPGVEKHISLEKFKTGKGRARKYRNRRIGELFKEIDLSEKQGTGITKILRELKKNGSPEPFFDMDEDRSYLETTIFIRDGFNQPSMSEKVSKKVSEIIPDRVVSRDGAHIDLIGEKTTFLMESTIFTDLEKNRLNRLIQYMIKFQSISSAKAANILDIQQKTASRLLAKAEKNDLFESEGRTKNKIYRLKRVS